MSDEILTLEDFERACIGHDLTYSYSDDHRCWQRGCISEDRINKAAQRFDRADVERIWNATVDKKMIEEYRQQFYWRWPIPAVSTGKGEQ